MRLTLWQKIEAFPPLHASLDPGNREEGGISLTGFRKAGGRTPNFLPLPLVGHGNIRQYSKTPKSRTKLEAVSSSPKISERRGRGEGRQGRPPFPREALEGQVLQMPRPSKVGSLRQPFPYHRGKAAPTLFMFQSPGLGMPGDGAPDGQAYYPGKKENGQPSQGGGVNPNSSFRAPSQGQPGRKITQTGEKTLICPLQKKGFPGSSLHFLKSKTPLHTFTCISDDQKEKILFFRGYFAARLLMKSKLALQVFSAFL